MSDRELVMRWVAGWSAMRGLRVEEVDGWPLIHVRARSRDSEVVCVDPGVQAFKRLAEHTSGQRRQMLTVFGRDLSAYQAVALPAGVGVDRDDEIFMATTLTPDRTQHPSGYFRRWDVDGSRATYRLETAVRIAAEGSVGITGTDAVFDVIETSPRHRRRGLARHVMGELTARAVDQGATTGLLAASADGARLYAALGWTTRLSMWSLMSAKP